MKTNLYHVPSEERLSLQQSSASRRGCLKLSHGILLPCRKVEEVWLFLSAIEKWSLDLDSSQKKSCVVDDFLQKARDFCLTSLVTEYTNV